MFWGGALFLEFVKSFFVGVVELSEFGFVEIVGGVVVAEFGVVKNVFFGLFFR